MVKPTLYLMLGFPGAGKTTASKAIHELTGAVHLWADHERRQMFAKPTHSHEENLALYKELNQRTDELLAQGKSVIFDTNFNFYKDREHLRQIAASHDAQTQLIWLTTPKTLAKQRATEQSHGQHTRVFGNMTEADFDRMSGNLQPPRNDEPYIALDGTQISSTYIQQKLSLHT